MKFIDEKGRLFGKINVIDFLVILLLICLTPMFYFGYRLLKKPEELPQKVINIELDFRLIRIKPEILELIKVGDKEIDEKGEIIGEIVRIGKSKPYQYMFDIGTSKEIFTIAKEDLKLKEIPVRLKLKAWIEGNSLYYKNRQITLKSPINFKTNQYITSAIPLKEKELKETWVEIKIKFSGIIPELAEIIAEKDTEKDPAGRVTGKLISIISKRFSDVLTLREDIFVKISHPFHKDIIALVDLLCIEKEGILYFKNCPVKVGNSITFTTDVYSVSGTIIGLEAKQC